MLLSAQEELPPEPEPPAPVEAAAPPPAAVPPPAVERTPAPPRFGSRGVLSVDAVATGIGYTSYGSSRAIAFDASFSPGADWFFAKGVFAGLDLIVVHSVERAYTPVLALVETQHTAVG